MVQTIRNAWKIPELRKKLIFTAFALLIFRLGSAVPVPFINTELLAGYLTNLSGTIFEMMNAMSGNAFAMGTVFALGVQPYINSSIIIQLLTIAIPALERLQKEGGEEGKRKITFITRVATVAIGVLQGSGYFLMLNSNGLLALAGAPSWVAGTVIILTFTAGSALVMWIGEQITEFGIGNGISMILFAGILSRVPAMVQTLWNYTSNWFNKLTEAEMSNWSDPQREAYFELNPAWTLLIVVGIVALIALVVYISNAERRIQVQYAKRVVGRKMYGGQSTHIPIKVNMSGVLPVIFAQAIASLPLTINSFMRPAEKDSFREGFMEAFKSTGFVYAVLLALLIVGFSYFYSTVQFNPIEVSNNLKKNGGFVPGFRPGRPTADFISKVLGKITMFGAIYLAILALIPIILSNLIGMSSLSIGGTSVIIVVGVALETTKVLESQMLMRHYKGFLE
jgi:preprotein translocase, SecY subunit